MVCCVRCGRSEGEHSREALTSPNPHNWKWRENACPVGPNPFHAEQTFSSGSDEEDKLRRQYETDLWRAHRTCEAIANLLSGPAPWVDAARVKAEEYAEYFKVECGKLKTS